VIDQTFSAENFKRIFHAESQKSFRFEKKFFPKLHGYSEKIQRFINFIKKTKKLWKKKIISDAAYHKRNELYRSKITELTQNKNHLLDEELYLLATKINARSFRLGVSLIDPSALPSGSKKMFEIDKDVCSYFASKQLQRNLKNVFEVKQANRHEIILQLKSILSNKFPKYIIKTDLKDFYESIDNEVLLNLVNHSQSLSHLSKKLIHQLLTSYQGLTSKKVGIPRGVGISAYLSELYMTDFDNKIKSLPDVIYYSRYVDDIIVVFTQCNTAISINYLDQIEKNIVNSKLQLNKSHDKTFKIDLLNSATKSFSYLGYDIKIQGENVSIRISRKKIDKYKKRIESCIKEYQVKNKFNKKREANILLTRIRFLTGNTKLVNGKGSINIGIFYSNFLASHYMEELEILDKYLQVNISQIQDSSLRDKISELSFSSGFVDKKFLIFSAKQLSQIQKVWKNV
jgi:hypothetical protein